TFERCNKQVEKMVFEVLAKHTTHQPLLDARVKIDLVFAMPDYDEKTGLPVNDALTHNGAPAYGIARKIPLKDRVLGRGDAEIAIDRTFWDRVDDEEKEALLDHELHHFQVKVDKRGLVT